MSQFFTPTDLALSLPILLLTIFALWILLVDTWFPPESKWMLAAAAFVGLVFSAVGVLKIQILQNQSGQSGRPLEWAFYHAMKVDHMAIYFYYLFLGGAALAILLSVHYLELEHENHGEFYALILFSVIGMMCMASGYDIVLIFIGLELMAISTYVLVGYLRRDRRSNEAALKYMLLGAFSSGIFAYGLSLLYGISGGTNLGQIQQVVAQMLMASGGKPNVVLILAMLTTMTGLLFKVAAIPFHQWAPDAYEGAPTCVTGFMSVAVKAAGWAMMLRILIWGLYPLRASWVPVLTIVSILTMTGANLAALTQSNLKRLLAYSSIAHVGYMLLGLVAMGSVTYPAPAFFTGLKGILLYLLVYTFMNLGAFAVVTSLRQRHVIGDELADINGLYQRAPLEAILMLVFLLSLAGIPPLAGFYGKYFIFLGLVESGHYILATVAVLYAVFGLYYYMKIASAMFMKEAEEKTRLPISVGVWAVLAVSALATIGIGLLPDRFIRIAQWSIGLG
ncbi:MAG TPA: NADH-quinone oxidoreductase subunit N [Terriglobales bacterium]